MIGLYKVLAEKINMLVAPLRKKPAAFTQRCQKPWMLEWAALGAQDSWRGRYFCEI